VSFLHRLVATTNVDKLRSQASKRELKRALTAKDLIAIGLGSMIGGGIFTTIGTGVQGAGPAVIVSYLLAGATAFFAALCYAELGSMVPIAGSAYSYTYATLGKVAAWIIGFALLFEYGISAAPVAQQFSAAIQDAAKTFGLSLPAWAQTSNLVMNGNWWELNRIDFAHSQYDIVAAIFVLVLSTLLSIGARRVHRRRRDALSRSEPPRFQSAWLGSDRSVRRRRRSVATVRNHPDRGVRFLQLHRLRCGDDDG
jgi:APA family basic amino acid/polyamine antiporter